MIIQIKQNANDEQIGSLISWLEDLGLHAAPAAGEEFRLLALTGDVSELDIDLIRSKTIVEDVKRITAPYKMASRRLHPSDTLISLNNACIGGGDLSIIAGPCSIESQEQLSTVAHAVKAAGATILRGGAFKPRSSPYSFQGLGADAIKMLIQAKKETGLPIITEIMDASQLHLFDEVDIIQVGARNMQNYELLKQLSKLKKPVLLKRNSACTLEELLMSAEYLLSGGNESLILCERGIRTFDPSTRNTLDIAAVPQLKRLSHLPVIVDPSHATGSARLVRPMALAAVASGADGIMIEVHNDPASALCDGTQSITPEAFKSLASAARLIHKALQAGEDDA